MKNIKDYCLVIILIFFFSCSQKEKESLLSIKFESYSFILRNNDSGSFPNIPIFEMKFTIKNQKNKINFFCSKGFFSDRRTYSKIYLLDTLRNKIVPVYSTSRPLIEGDKEYDIFATINLKENKDYFNLSEDFFVKDNYYKDTEKLNDLFLGMINNSIIVYNQDERDLNGFRLNDINPDVINKNVIIEIQKPKNLTKKYFGIKKKPIKIVN